MIGSRKGAGNPAAWLLRHERFTHQRKKDRSRNVGSAESLSVGSALSLCVTIGFQVSGCHLQPVVSRPMVVRRGSVRSHCSTATLCCVLVVLQAECAVEWNRGKVEGIQNQSDHVGIYLQQEIRCRT